MHTRNNIKSEKDGLYTIKQNKLCCPSMMIHLLDDGITFLPYGHYNFFLLLMEGSMVSLHSISSNKIVLTLSDLSSMLLYPVSFF